MAVNKQDQVELFYGNVADNLVSFFNFNFFACMSSLVVLCTLTVHICGQFSFDVF